MRPDRDDRSYRYECRSNGRRTVAIVTGMTVLLTLSIAGTAGTVAAIDQVAILSPDRTQLEAGPGETIEIDVTLQSRGGHGSEGITSVRLVAQYNPEYIEITDIEHGSWLEGDGTEVRTGEAIAHEQGTAILDRRRVPPAGGTTGNGTFATLTVRVAADAPAGATTISFGESDVDLTGDWPIAVVDESATVSIDGGDEPLETFDHADPDELDLGLESRGSSPETDSSESDETSETDGSLPVSGFTSPVALTAVAIAAVRLWLGRHYHRE
ncbi:cohesin domain-containing protein [Natrinema halophilum]|uniref:Cellulosome anchor protein n=1 Tax=Natrinema halophilum TaxID=1699371 RepID=A0A7D5L3J8_9EURY|nr:cohesin domain-containing protein [Natrinema halophilum]QLG50405.1 cellulosome anchor protein [Natrinema halophilum]